MTVLFRREVPVRDVVAVQSRHAHALQAPIRLVMLDLLCTRPMSVDELAEELPAHGFKKATNTLRHHLDILVKAGLVELALLEQTRGAVLKYFSGSTRPLHYRLADGSEPDLQALADRLYPTMEAALRELRRAEPSRVNRLVEGIPKCPRCTGEFYTDYVLLSALHRACANYLRNQNSPPTPAATASPPRRVPRGVRPKMR
jgi:DNA-binding transcriptional ArsR family regulator